MICLGEEVGKRASLLYVYVAFKSNSFFGDICTCTLHDRVPLTNSQKL